MDYEQMALEILQKATETDDLAEDMDLNLFDAELLDSMSVISIIINIEERTGKRLEPTDFTRDDIKTVHNFARFLKEKVG
jgi:D-alanine--poly(phosphoribitol) ligase subunit 2